MKTTKFWKRFTLVVAFMAMIFESGKHYNKVLAYLEKDKPTLIELAEGNSEFKRLACEINEIIGADRTGIDLSADYNKGLFVAANLTEGIDVVSVQECSLVEISSLEDRVKSVNAFYFNDFIRGIEENDSTPGTLIIDINNPPKEGYVKEHIDSEKIKAIAYVGIYRKPFNQNQKRYLVGVVIVTFIKEQHLFTKAEISVIKANVQTIAVLFENIYLQMER